MALKQFFTEHPESVGESYLEHMNVALSFAVPLLAAGLAALIHAFLPFLFLTTTSRTVKQLHARMMNRHPHAVSRDTHDRMLAWDPVI
jgi:Family of unknown function (DUF6356)